MSCGNRGWTLVELLVALGIVGLLLALLFPAMARSREAARQLQCRVNLRNWGQALAGYVAVNQSYPAAAVQRNGMHPDGHAVPARHGIYSFLLPFIEQTSLAAKINLAFDWNAPENAAWTRIDLDGIFLCPSAPVSRRGKHACDYAPAVRVDPSRPSGLGRLIEAGHVSNRSRRKGPSWGRGEDVWEGVLPVHVVDYGRQTSERPTVYPHNVRDGISHTLTLLENAGKPICYRFGRQADCVITRFRWASPHLWLTINDVCGQQQLLNCHNNSQPYAFHPRMIHVLLADGAVRELDQDIAADLFVSFVTRAARD